MGVRQTISPLEASIITTVKDYLKSRADELAESKNTSVDVSVNVMADAITLGINEAFKGPLLHSMIAPIIDTLIAGAVPPVIPTGTTIITPLLDVGTAPTVPNPLIPSDRAT